MPAQPAADDGTRGGPAHQGARETRRVRCPDREDRNYHPAPGGTASRPELQAKG